MCYTAKFRNRSSQRQMVIEYLLQARHYYAVVIYTTALSLVLLSPSFYKCRNRGTENLIPLPKASNWDLNLNSWLLHYAV